VEQCVEAMRYAVVWWST